MLDYNKTILKPYFLKYNFNWEILVNLKETIIEFGSTLSNEEYSLTYCSNKMPIWVHKNAQVSKTANLNGPLIVCDNAEIRHNAYIRGPVVLDKFAIVGNSTEVKNSILFENAKAPHFNYVGDSIVGYNVNLGAGVILSNVKNMKSTISCIYNDETIDTNMYKLGSIIGDNVKIGCNSVLNPGTIVGKDTIIYPLLNINGTIKERSILKNKKLPLIVERKESDESDRTDD